MFFENFLKVKWFGVLLLNIITFPLSADGPMANPCVIFDRACGLFEETRCVRIMDELSQMGDMVVGGPPIRQDDVLETIQRLMTDAKSLEIKEIDRVRLILEYLDRNKTTFPETVEDLRRTLQLDDVKARLSVEFNEEMERVYATVRHKNRFERVSPGKFRTLYQPKRLPKPKSLQRDLQAFNGNRDTFVRENFKQEARQTYIALGGLSEEGAIKFVRPLKNEEGKIVKFIEIDLDRLEDLGEGALRDIRLEIEVDKFPAEVRPHLVRMVDEMTTHGPGTTKFFRMLNDVNSLAVVRRLRNRNFYTPDNIGSILITVEQHPEKFEVFYELPGTSKPRPSGIIKTIRSKNGIFSMVQNVKYNANGELVVIDSELMVKRAGNSPLDENLMDFYAYDEKGNITSGFSADAGANEIRDLKGNLLARQFKHASADKTQAPQGCIGCHVRSTKPSPQAPVSMGKFSATAQRFPHQIHTDIKEVTPEIITQAYMKDRQVIPDELMEALRRKKSPILEEVESYMKPIDEALERVRKE